MEQMRGQFFVYKRGKLIDEGYVTSRYVMDGKSEPHLRGAIVRQARKRTLDIGGDRVDIWIHYSVLPNGPFYTRGIGSVKL